VGHAQARAAATALAEHPFSAIYSSDLLRVRQTAEPAAQRLALPVKVDAQLRERHYGIFECLLYSDVKQRYPREYARFHDKDPEFDFGTGESLRFFFERSIAAVRNIADMHRGEQVLVFTHGGVLDMSTGTAMPWDSPARVSSACRTRDSIGSRLTMTAEGAAGPIRRIDGARRFARLRLAFCVEFISVRGAFAPHRRAHGNLKIRLR
jgi:broad specificity phosphatase PhoE